MGLSTQGGNVALAFKNHISTCFGLAVAGSNQFAQFSVHDQMDRIRNSVACHITSDLDFNQGRLCNSDLSGLKFSVNIANSCSNI